HRVQGFAERTAIDSVEVGARAETRTGAGDHDRAGGLGGGGLDRLLQRPAVLDVEGVAALVPVDLDDVDIAVTVSSDHVSSRAVRLGLRLIDTAPLYWYGLAESRLGACSARARRGAR